MNKNKIQTMINVEIINKMADGSAASVLKNILFDANNTIDWDKAYEMAMVFMPELKCHAGYKSENMM